MVALVVSILVTLLMAAGVYWYMNRRPLDAPLTWGEGMFGATYVFMMLFMVFGVVPHQWLTLAENEWSFRADRLFTAGGLIEPQSQGGWFPFDITLRAISDAVAALIYIIFLGAMIAMWMQWQNRGKAADAGTDVVKSTYGRPLIRRG